MNILLIFSLILIFILITILIIIVYKLNNTVKKYKMVPNVLAVKPEKNESIEAFNKIRNIYNDLINKCIEYELPSGKLFKNFDEFLDKIEEAVNFPLFYHKNIIALCGQFSSGKTRMINSFLGKDILPTAIERATAINTFVSYGEEERLFIKNNFGGETEIKKEFFKEYDEFVKDFVNDTSNNKNILDMVKYVSLNTEKLKYKNIALLDTPGLNDPVISRGQLTRNFLGKCDVVFLLSPSGQFFDSQDISLFSEQLPQEGIKEVVVIGSKFDNGIIGESEKYNRDIKVAKEGVKNVLNEQFKARIKDSDRKDIFEKAYPPHYISSACYDIYKHYGKLSKIEVNIKNNIMRAFPKFKDSTENFKELSGMEIFNDEIIPKIVSKKVEIFEERKKEIYSGFEDKFKKLTEELHEEVKRKQEELSSGDIKSLEEKVKSTLKNVEKLKYSIKDCYDEKTHEIRVKFQDLLTEIRDIIEANSGVKERTKTENYTVIVEKDGLLSLIARLFGLGGYREEERKRYVSYASVQDAIEQINKIIKESQKRINTECRNIFNIEDFCNSITNKLMEVFDLADKDFEPDSIILPLKKVLRSISISSVELNKDYADIIVEKVSGNNETSVIVMQEGMRKTTRDILKDIEKALDYQTKEIVSKLDEQANNLIKDTSSSIEKDAEEMKRQLKDKKKYEELYKEAISNIEDIRNNIN